MPWRAPPDRGRPPPLGAHSMSARTPGGRGSTKPDLLEMPPTRTALPRRALVLGWTCLNPSGSGVFVYKPKQFVEVLRQRLIENGTERTPKCRLAESPPTA